MRFIGLNAVIFLNTSEVPIRIGWYEYCCTNLLCVALLLHTTKGYVFPSRSEVGLDGAIETIPSSDGG